MRRETAALFVFVDYVAVLGRCRSRYESGRVCQVDNRIPVQSHMKLSNTQFYYQPSSREGRLSAEHGAMPEDTGKESSAWVTNDLRASPHVPS